MKQCKFDMTYRGRCKEVAAHDDFCKAHSQKKCCVCGNQATHECSHAGQFVCGAPLCPSCEGFVDDSKSSGSWGFMNHGHRHKEHPMEQQT